MALDTNTIVSALYRKGSARDILRLFYHGALTLAVSPFIVTDHHAFLDLHEHEGIVIVTAREFLATLGSV